MAPPHKAAGKKLLFVIAKVSQTSQKLTGLFLDFQAAVMFNGKNSSQNSQPTKPFLSS